MVSWQPPVSSSYGNRFRSCSLQIVQLDDHGARAGYLFHKYKTYESSYSPTAARPLPQILPSFSSLQFGTRSQPKRPLRATSLCAGASRQRRRNSDLQGLEKLTAVTSTKTICLSVRSSTCPAPAAKAPPDLVEKSPAE